jgi:hypothetical protein
MARYRTKRNRVRVDDRAAVFPSGKARTKALEAALCAGVRVHWHDGEPSGWLRLPATGGVVWVNQAEVCGLYRKLLLDARQAVALGSPESNADGGA